MPRPQGSITCPACNNRLAPRSIHQHTSSCAEWKKLYGAPIPKFKYDPFVTHRKPLFLPEAVEGVDFVRCKICEQYGWDFRFSRLTSHIKCHGWTVVEYEKKYPGAPIRLKKTIEKRVKTTQERYGVDNVFQAEEVRKKVEKTLLSRYGTKNVREIEGVNEKIALTNTQKYGSENPFGSSEIQKKIRETHLRDRGVENPNQDPEVMARRIATNREKYGVDHFLQTEEFQEKFRNTSRERWGADHPMQSEEGQEILRQIFLERYGAETPLLLPEVQKKAYETNLRNHGGKHSQQCPEVLEKARKTWMEKYGVDNPSKAEEVKERIKQVWMGKYGVPFPPQSLWANRGKGASRARNPDFVILTRDQVKAYRKGALLNDLRTGAVIEAFGDYWHGPQKTGKSREEHKREVIAYYEKAGIRCLVLWEKEIKSNPKRVAERMRRFLAEWQLLRRFGV
jgi:hypothetical protein